MPAPTKPQAPQGNEPETTQTLAYWMGRVDANIAELKTSINTFFEKSEDRWGEFDAWRRQVDERLVKGNSIFIEHGRRLDGLEASKATTNGNGKGKFGTWEWFRDGYLEKFVLVVLTVIIYKIIEIIVVNWTITTNLK